MGTRILRGRGITAEDRADAPARDGGERVDGAGAVAGPGGDRPVHEGEIRRVIEEAHQTAHRVLREHMEELHKFSVILIERETIDKDQFERLLAGEAEETIFPEEIVEPVEEPVEGPERKPAPKPKPRPVPGVSMQPPEPDDPTG